MVCSGIFRLESALSVSDSADRRINRCEYHDFIRRPDAMASSGKRPGFPAFFVFTAIPRTTAPHRLRGHSLKHACGVILSPFCAQSAEAGFRPPYPGSAKCCRYPDPSGIQPDHGDLGGRTGPWAYQLRVDQAQFFAHPLHGPAFHFEAETGQSVFFVQLMKFAKKSLA